MVILSLIYHGIPCKLFDPQQIVYFAICVPFEFQTIILLIVQKSCLFDLFNLVQNLLRI